MVSSDDQPAQAEASGLVASRAGDRAATRLRPARAAQSGAGGAGPLLEVRNLRAQFQLADRVARAVEGVSFSIAPGEIVGLVGESGCGKSVTTQCILRTLPPPGRITEGEILFQGADLLKKSREEMRAIRGRHISIVLQDALAALNPVIPTGEQVADVYQAHRPATKKQAWERAVDMFRRTGIQNAARMVRRYAHEFSGGMQQRVVIAAALACEPDLIIADEPTTALDVTIQLQILSLLRGARDQLGSAVLYISHDLAAVAQICDRVLIMYRGEIVEQAPAAELFRAPKHPYTQGLLASIPPLAGEPRRYLPAIPGLPPDPTADITGCRFAARCPYVMGVCSEHPPLFEVGAEHRTRCYLYDPARAMATHARAEAWLDGARTRPRPAPSDAAADSRPLVEARNLSKHFAPHGLWSPARVDQTRAVDDVSLSIAEGTVMGLVGESGSGKTTLGRMLVRLVEPSSGQVLFDGRDITSLSGRDLLAYRRQAQIIFQNPYSSLNPRRSVADSLGVGYDVFGIARGRERRARLAALLDRVGLGPEVLDRYPHQFSGGQRQRLVIARALTVEPRFIVADEPVSALDVSIQAQILNLLRALQEDFRFTMLLISHDLRSIYHMSDRIGVMYLGRLVEVAPKRRLYEQPLHPYTRALIAAAPSLEARAPASGAPIKGELLDQPPPVGGCVFYPRCPLATDACRRIVPPLEDKEPDHAVACWRV
jgi:peptide/nickel transport system ATP-binding protein